MAKPSAAPKLPIRETDSSADPSDSNGSGAPTPPEGEPINISDLATDLARRIGETIYSAGGLNNVTNEDWDTIGDDVKKTLPGRGVFEHQGSRPRSALETQIIDQSKNYAEQRALGVSADLSDPRVDPGKVAKLVEATAQQDGITLGGPVEGQSAKDHAEKCAKDINTLTRYALVSAAVARSNPTHLIESGRDDVAEQYMAELSEAAVAAGVVIGIRGQDELRAYSQYAHLWTAKRSRELAERDHEGPLVSAYDLAPPRRFFDSWCQLKSPDLEGTLADQAGEWWNTDDSPEDYEQASPLAIRLRYAAQEVIGSQYFREGDRGIKRGQIRDLISRAQKSLDVSVQGAVAKGGDRQLVISGIEEDRLRMHAEHVKSGGLTLIEAATLQLYGTFPDGYVERNKYIEDNFGPGDDTLVKQDAILLYDTAVVLAGRAGIDADTQLSQELASLESSEELVQSQQSTEDSEADNSVTESEMDQQSVQDRLEGLGLQETLTRLPQPIADNLNQLVNAGSFPDINNPEFATQIRNTITAYYRENARDLGLVSSGRLGRRGRGLSNEDIRFINALASRHAEEYVQSIPTARGRL